jgi:hypothetical protein
MKNVRRSVFETNSSSSHSLSLHYGEVSEDLELTLPINRSSEVKKFNIFKYPIVQEGYAFSEIEKLRIIVALITEFAADEYKEKVQKEWMVKNNLSRFSWTSAYHDFYMKKTTLKGAKTFMYEHRFWKYLNAVLKKRLNIHILLPETHGYFPFISDFVDDGLGAETRGYYRELGWSFKTTREEFMKQVDDIIFNPEISFWQETWYNH